MESGACTCKIRYKFIGNFRKQGKIWKSHINMIIFWGSLRFGILRGSGKSQFSSIIKVIQKWAGEGWGLIVNCSSGDSYFEHGELSKIVSKTS